MVSFKEFPQSDRLILLAACCFIILAGIKMAGEFIGPLLMSIFAAIIFSFVSMWFQKRGISPRLASYIAFGVFLACLISVMAMVLLSASPLINYIPKIETGVSSNMDSVEIYFSNLGIDISTIIPATQMSRSLSAISPEMVTSVIVQISTLFIALFTTLFLLLESTIFSKKINSALGSYKQELAESGG